MRVLADGETFYGRVLAERPGTEAALFALIRLFAVQAARMEWEPAIRSMEEVLAAPRFHDEDKVGRMAALGRLKISEIYATELKQPEAALRVVRGVLAGGAPKELLPGARVLEAKSLASAGRHPEALADLDRVLT